MGLKWVYNVKKNTEGKVIKHKARLMAKWYVQQQGVNYEETFSLVTHLETMHLLLASAAKSGWESTIWMNKFCEYYEFQQQMSHEFDMSDLGRLFYYLRIKVEEKKGCIELRKTTFGSDFKNQRIVLRRERKFHVINVPRPEPFPEGATYVQQAAYQKHIDADMYVTYLMLATMSPELQKQYEHMNAYIMIDHLKCMFEERARQERFDTSKALYACKQGDRDLIPTKLLAMLETVETNIQTVSPAPIMMALKPGGDIAKGDTSHYCKKPGHWKRNYHVFLEDLENKKAAGASDSYNGYGSHICINMQELQESSILAKGEVDLRVGNIVKIVPMVKSIRILLAVAAQYYYEIWQMDVKTAFLNGSLEEDIYMIQPEGFFNPKFVKMTKDLFLLYGGDEKLVVLGYTDGSFQIDRDDLISQLRFMFFLNGGVKFITGLSVVPSITYLVDLYCDNNGAIAQAKEPRSHFKAKYILKRYYLFLEINERRDIHIYIVHIDDNIADPLTKLYRSRSTAVILVPWVLDT
ncbi:uncharacterized protein LOC141680740 [Apium graveolens]|uniref:uncharacterized protein LOC141680740 n=1 Tax=Apium graveolens TaxID=4045 RepID=UPI003D7A2ECB